jgi:hypothetical protein
MTPGVSKQVQERHAPDSAFRQIKRGFWIGISTAACRFRVLRQRSGGALNGRRLGCMDRREPPSSACPVDSFTA